MKGGWRNGFWRKLSLCRCEGVVLLGFQVILTRRGSSTDVGVSAYSWRIGVCVAYRQWIFIIIQIQRLGQDDGVCLLHNLRRLFGKLVVGDVSQLLIRPCGALHS